MNDNGWIKFHRKIRDSACYNDPNPWVYKVWSECLICASHSKHTILRRGEEVVIYPGEFLYSRTSWSKRLGLSPSTLRNIIGKLQKWDMIQDIHKDSGISTIYKVKKWSEYQERDSLQDTPQDSFRTASGQLEDTKKKEKNEKNNIYTYEKIESLTHETLTQVSIHYRVRIKDLEGIQEELTLYCQATGKKYKDYKAALMSWTRKKIQEGKIGIIPEEKPLPVEPDISSLPKRRERLDEIRSALQKKLSA